MEDLFTINGERHGPSHPHTFDGGKKYETYDTCVTLKKDLDALLLKRGFPPGWKIDVVCDPAKRTVDWALTYPQDPEKPDFDDWPAAVAWYTAVPGAPGEPTPEEIEDAQQAVLEKVPVTSKLSCRRAIESNIYIRLCRQAAFDGHERVMMYVLPGNRSEYDPQAVADYLVKGAVPAVGEAAKDLADTACKGIQQADRPTGTRSRPPPSPETPFAKFMQHRSLQTGQEALKFVAGNPDHVAVAMQALLEGRPKIGGEALTLTELAEVLEQEITSVMQGQFGDLLYLPEIVRRADGLSEALLRERRMYNAQKARDREETEEADDDKEGEEDYVANDEELVRKTLEVLLGPQWRGLDADQVGRLLRAHPLLQASPLRGPAAPSARITPSLKAAADLLAQWRRTDGDDPEVRADIIACIVGQWKALTFEAVKGDPEQEYEEQEDDVVSIDKEEAESSSSESYDWTDSSDGSASYVPPDETDSDDADSGSDDADSGPGAERPSKRARLSP